MIAQNINPITFFGMNGNYSPEPGRYLQHLTQFIITDSDCVPVGQINFKRTDTLLFNTHPHLFRNGFVPPGNSYNFV